MTIVDVGRALRERKVSVTELAQEALAAAARTNSSINAFITITEEAALKRAAELDEDLARGIDHGPLHGIPVAHNIGSFLRIRSQRLGASPGGSSTGDVSQDSTIHYSP